MRIDLPTDKRLVHTMTIPIRWGDMDAMGHVNNTVYFRYMESARLQWMGEWGMPANPRGCGPVIANAFCNFWRQLEYPGDVIVRSYVGALGQRSFDMFHELLRADGVIPSMPTGARRWCGWTFRRSARCRCPLRCASGWPGASLDLGQAAEQIELVVGLHAAEGRHAVGQTEEGGDAAMSQMSSSSRPCACSAQSRRRRWRVIAGRPSSRSLGWRAGAG
jgi:acyl-CoA thioester hydrolase